MTSTLSSILSEDVGPAEWPQGLPDHLSASSLSLFAKCPELWRRKYLIQDEEPKNGNKAWGSADHKAIAHNLTQKITSGVDLPVDEVVDVFHTTLATEAASVEVWDKSTPEDAAEIGERLVRFYHEFVAPRVQPITVEEEFSIRVPGVGVPITGYLDVRGLVDGTRRRIIERKTSASDVNVLPPWYRLQGRIYPLVHPDTPLDWHVSVKGKGIVVTPDERPALTVTLTDESRLATEQLLAQRTRSILAHWHTFGPDEPWPDALENAWVCKGCSHRPTCVYWSGS